jgi:predicted RNase H-like nuclease
VFLSAIPFLNILVFLKLTNDLFNRFKKSENKSKNSNYDKKTLKKYPHLNTLNMLKEIKKMYEQEIKITFKNEEIDKFLVVKQKLNETIDFLEENYQEDYFHQLLNTYEISFAKLLSIFKESLSIEKKVADDVLFAGRELLEQFCDKVNSRISNDDVIENETKEKIRERFVKDIKGEIEFHKKSIFTTLTLKEPNS